MGHGCFPAISILPNPMDPHPVYPLANWATSEPGNDADRAEETPAIRARVSEADASIL